MLSAYTRMFYSCMFLMWFIISIIWLVLGSRPWKKRFACKAFLFIFLQCNIINISFVKIKYSIYYCLIDRSIDWLILYLLTLFLNYWLTWFLNYWFDRLFLWKKMFDWKGVDCLRSDYVNILNLWMYCYLW